MGQYVETSKKGHKDPIKRWINKEVINFYFKNYLAEMDQKQCQDEPEQNCSGFRACTFGKS